MPEPMGMHEPKGFAARMHDLRTGPVSAPRQQKRRLADAMRLVIERLVSTRAPEDRLAAAAEALEAIAADLGSFPAGQPFDGFAESANSGDPHAFFDHSPIIGRANPLAPPLDLGVDATRTKVVGTGRFGSAYEGPPGAVHGGCVAAAFDEVLGMTQSLSGQPGMTGTLTIRYRRPHPLHTTIEYEGELVRVDGRKIFTVGRSYANGELLAEAEAVFISVDFSKIAELLARRDPPAPDAPPS